jgi:hypothetical protein
MNDMKGREIQVGDTVVYASEAGRSIYMTEGVVLEVGATWVKVDRKSRGGYFPIVDGKRTRMVWDGKGYVEVTTKVKPVTIGMPDRCLITSR